MHKRQSRWYHRNDGIKLNTLKPETHATVAIIWLVTLILVAVTWHVEQVDKRELVKTAYATEEVAGKSAELEVVTDEQAEIKAYIQEVFGVDAPKAFTVLSCENSALNPNAVNTAGNSPAGSRDIGVFQINEYWQKTQGKFLFNWKVNVEIAHQLFEENGKSFKLWSCGKKLGV